MLAYNFLCTHKGCVVPRSLFHFQDFCFYEAKTFPNFWFDI